MRKFTGPRPQTCRPQLCARANPDSVIKVRSLTRPAGREPATSSWPTSNIIAPNRRSGRVQGAGSSATGDADGDDLRGLAAAYPGPQEPGGAGVRVIWRDAGPLGLSLCRRAVTGAARPGCGSGHGWREG